VPNRTKEVVSRVDCDAWVNVHSLDDFADLRRRHQETSTHWWPEIGPLPDASSFSFTHRIRRLGPITVLDADFHEGVWVNGGDVRPHYHVTVPVSNSAAGNDISVTAAPGPVAVYRAEGKASVSGYAGRLLAVMIDRYAVEEALADALGRAIIPHIDFQPHMATTTHAVQSWIALVSVFTEQLFHARSVLHQPMVAMPFAESVIRGFLLATDHSYRAAFAGAVSDPPPRAIRAAIDVIESEAHLPLTVSALAARTHVSTRSLQQGFRTYVGTTPMGYLRDVRLRRARQDLRDSDPSVDKVASVALRWGFTNLGRFAAAYARRYGESPAVTLRGSGNRTVIALPPGVA
jgi:AraC-like DNA-binding protein